MQKKINLGVIIILAFSLVPYLAQAKMSNDPFVQQWAYEDLGVYKAWDYTVGSNDIIVAVIDNGFDTFHPDLRGNVWKNEKEIANNGIDDDNNGYIDDVYGWNFLDDNNNPRPDASNLEESELEKGIINHGTFVAGLIGATGNNKLDGVGINWKVKLMNLKVLGNSGVGSLTPLKDAIHYAVDNGADIINISMVGSQDDGITDAIDYAYRNGVLVVAAAGNNMYNLDDYPFYPVCSDANLVDEERVLGISAMDESHHLATFSNIGSSCIDLTAPGMGIDSTARFSPSNGLKDRYITDWDGTSFATPFVAGAAALIKSIQPDWDPAEIIKALLSTAHHTPGQDEEEYASLFGSGLLQIDKAVQYAIKNSNDLPVEDNTDTDTETENNQNDRNKIYNIEEPRYVEIDKVSGYIDTYNVANTWMGSNLVSEAVDADDVDAYVKNNGEVLYVIAKRKNELSHTITLYNSEWIEQYSWGVETTEGKVDVTLADIMGDDEPEVIVASPYGSSSVLRIYDTMGRFMQSKSIDGSFGNVSVDVSFNKERGKYDLGLLYHSGKLFMLELLDGNLNTISKKRIVGFRHDASLAIGDIDGDGEDEYAIIGGVGELPRVDFYETDLSLLKRMTLINDKLRTGISGHIFDFAPGGKEELVIIPYDVGPYMSIINIRGELIDEKIPFEDLGNAEVLLAPIR